MKYIICNHGKQVCSSCSGLMFIFCIVFVSMGNFTPFCCFLRQDSHHVIFVDIASITSSFFAAEKVRFGHSIVSLWHVHHASPNTGFTVCLRVGPLHHAVGSHLPVFRRLLSWLRLLLLLSGTVHCNPGPALSPV